MSRKLPKTYDPSSVQGPIYRRWLEAGAFRATPDERRDRYVIMMPLPNVTGALHMGHAMDNVMQDLLIRWHRMKGDNTLWQPGTDHAGIATQAVVEKRLFELEGKTRHDIGREALVERIFEWKDRFQARIVRQQQEMGCSCDWDRQRFTMDEVCAKAVRETFFRMFRDGLIHRGARLVNWDCHLRTAISDDEIEYRTVRGHFWHLRYPFLEPEEGEPSEVVVATTRPETMLGDTAVAVHPDPRGVLESLKSSDPEAAELLEERLPLLESLVRMAKAGRRLRLPLLGREIPLILDEWAKPEKGSGCVKITPAHDPNDYEVWLRHREEIDCINLLEPDGRYNDRAGPYAGLDRFEVRKRVLADLEAGGYLVAVEDREIEIGHSDRSKTPIEPFLSKQWFIRMGDMEGGVVMGRGTEKEFRAEGLAQAAIDAVRGDWRSATGRKLAFYPDPERYANTYVNWLSEKRDWCISRQLWWGHRIPIWHGNPGAEDREKIREAVPAGDPDVVFREDGEEVQVCLRNPEAEGRLAGFLESHGLEHDPDVLDTWFSSALWPHSTLGWPEPNPDLDYYYPGSCLVTGRDIITLWVVRMVVMGLYNLGDLPFTDVFIHANILDGKGERMSKSKGNGIDPVDIIEVYGADAMRYVLADMQTGMQDIRLPVQAVSPFTGKFVDLATAKHGRSVFTYLCPETGKEFDVLGTMSDLPSAKILSDRFEVGRNFCNKLWNAVRFALLNLEGTVFTPLDLGSLDPEDRWILSRTARAVAGTEERLRAYNPSAAIGGIREWFWGEVCDWYLELCKPRLSDEGRAPAVRQVLAFVLDQALRLLHPFVPFVTEALFEALDGLAPERGIEEALPREALLVKARWPEPREAHFDPALERDFDLCREAVRAARDLRARHQVPPKARLEAVILADGEAREALERLKPVLELLAGLERVEIGPDLPRPELAATAIFGDRELHLGGVLDPRKERRRLEKQLAELEGLVSSLERKLANPSFLERAPAEIVVREKRRLEETLGRSRKVRAALEALPPS